MRTGTFEFVCSECGARYRERDVRYVCPSCSTRQVRGGPTRGVLEVSLARLPGTWPDSSRTDRPASARFLPVARASGLAPLAVGGTPLLAVPRLRETLGMPHLWLKDDTRNPSGSTKDRASLLVVAKAREYGVTTVACASTGNAAAALAAVAAATAGMRAVVFVPAGAPPAKLVQVAVCGAELVPVAGSYDDAFELSLACCDRFGWYNRNTAFNPFTIEGKKTVALEIGAQLRPDGPDVVLVPTGDGVIVAGVAKGFADLVRAGLLPRAPRLVAVQPEGSSALARALRDGADEITPVSAPASVADSLVVGAPRNALLALRVVRASGGTGVIVSDRAISAAQVRLARESGVFAEPAGAAALAGLEVALDEGRVGREERAVLLVTGSGLKDAGALARTLTLPAPVPPDVDAVAARLGRSAPTLVPPVAPVRLAGDL